MTHTTSVRVKAKIFNTLIKTWHRQKKNQSLEYEYFYDLAY
jgi:hypothetical protein